MNNNTFFIPGPMGPVEALLTEGTSPIIAVICHPHPLHGGTMHNKVITSLAKVCEILHIPSLRFNYRGVGGSAGTYGNIEGEIDDLDAVIHWAKEKYPQHQLWLMGFSFGAYIAARGAVTHPTQCLVNVAPAVQYAHFDTLPLITCPWFILQGEQDEIVPPQLVYDFAHNRPEQPTLITFPDTGHFFHRMLIPLRNTLIERLTALT